MSPAISAAIVAGEYEIFSKAGLAITALAERFTGKPGAIRLESIGIAAGMGAVEWQA